MKDIEKFNPCREAVKYRRKFKTFREAWDNCNRGDWMLWIASEYGVSFRKLTLAKGYCANTVRHLMKDERSIKAVDLAISYGSNNGTTKAELNAAADDAADAAAYADAYAAAYADAYADAAYARRKKQAIRLRRMINNPFKGM